jgi:dihydrolipoamide dehydrogenase
MEKRRHWQLASGIEKLCEARGVRLLRARALFTASDTLHAVPASAGAAEGIPEFLEFRARHSRGGVAALYPLPCAWEDPRVMDSSLALDLPEIPGSLLVVGGIHRTRNGRGLRLARLACNVVELSDGLLPGADRDLVRPLQARLKRNMAAIHLNTKVESLAPGEKAFW